MDPLTKLRVHKDFLLLLNKDTKLRVRKDLLLLFNKDTKLRVHKDLLLLFNKDTKLFLTVRYSCGLWLVDLSAGHRTLLKYFFKKRNFISLIQS